MNPQELSALFLKTASDLSASREKRRVPSPSSHMYCHRRNWFSAKGVEPTEKPDGESYISAESGTASEPILASVIEAMGLGTLFYATGDVEGRELQPHHLEAISMAGGQFDNLLQMHGGELALVEFKRKGVFDILSLWRSGVINACPNDYMQAQALMRGLRQDTKINRCLYVAANWDRGALTRFAKTSKGDKERPPGAYLEWIEYVPAAAAVSVKRAETQQRFIDTLEKAKDVPREYDPFGGKDWQCNWCSWTTVCKAAG